MYDALAEFYDRLDDNPDRERWAEYLETLVRKYACGDRGADLGCGTGTLTELLAKRLRIVCACDCSERMLNRAAKRLRIPLVQADFRKFRAPAKLDFLILANDGLNYICPSERRRLFRHLRGQIVRGGARLFDISSPYKLREVLDGQLYFSEDENLSMFWQNRLEGDALHLSLVFFERSGEVYRRSEEEQIQYVHEPEEILRDLRDTGFEVYGPFGMFGELPPDREELRLQFVAVGV